MVMMPHWMLIALVGSALIPATAADAPLWAQGAAADDAGVSNTDAGPLDVGDAGADASGEVGARGVHRRIATAHGPVHVWTPEAYNHETAGIVVYVHGYYTSVDEAWHKHNLAAQFAASGRNALFIVPEAPSHNWHEVRWTDLGDLIRTVRRSLNLKRPWGPVVAVGHSGAYRTLIPWLEYRQLSHVILLDGLYGHEEPFANWLGQVKAVTNRITLVAIDTLRWSEPWARAFGYAHTLDWVPETLRDIGAEARAAQLLYIRSQYDHMDIVTRGRVMPVLLQATAIAALAEAGP
jgi:hypothetical protein